MISIHAPREGSDGPTRAPCGSMNISIHAPREGSDLPRLLAGRIQPQNFYPRSPRGERRATVSLIDIETGISIHAPREGSDSPSPRRGRTASYFYPRSPRGERPADLKESGQLEQEFLSTLPARGATLSGEVTPNSFFNFYPRSPRGERQVK